MEPNQRKRFSFTDAAAQQPERQRFSFSQKTKAEKAIPTYASLFPTKQRLVDLAMAPRVAAAPKSQTKNEFNSILEAGKSQTISQGAPSLSDRARRNLPKGLTEPFIGTGLQANTPGGNSDKGFIGWNFEELTKSDSERFDEFSSLLQQKTGASEERARDLAGRLVTKEQIDDLTDSERKAISTQKTLNFAFGALESLDFLPLVGGTISKGAKLGKSSILNRILKDTNPISIARELKLANPVFNLGDVTTLSNDLSKTSNAKDAQSLIDNFVQTTQKAAAPQAPKRFSFSKAAQPDLAATRDVIIRRLEAEVPLNNKTTGVGAASRQASILNSDDVADAVSTALETLKKTPDPTLNQLNEAVQALRVSGRQADDVLADLAKVETPPVVTQRAGASDIKKPGRFSFAAEALKNPALRKGGFAGRVPEGFPGQRAAVRESVSSVDDSTKLPKIEERFVENFPEIGSADNIAQLRSKTRGVRSNQESLDAARQLGFNVNRIRNIKEGTALNAEQKMAVSGVIESERLNLKTLEEALARTEPGTAAYNQARDLFAKQKVQLFELMAIERGVAAEAGRALQAYKSTVTAIDKHERQISKYLADPKKSQDVKDYIYKKIAEFDGTPDEMANLLRELDQASLIEMMVEFATAAKLWTPATHVVNMISSSTRMLMNAPVHSISAMFDAVVSKLTGKARTRFMSDAFAEVQGQITGWKHAGREATKALKDEDYAFRARILDDVETKGPAIKGRPGKNGLSDRFLNVFGKAVRIPFRALGAEDLLLRKPSEMGAMYVALNRKARMDGLTPNSKEWNDFMQKSLGDPVGEMGVDFMKEIQTIADENLFQEALHPSLKRISDIRETVPALKFIVPFFRTIVNLQKQAIQFSPMSPILPSTRTALKGGGGPQADALAKMTLGTAVTIPLVFHALEGNITLAAPTNAAERDSFYAEGKVPYAVRIGDKWWPYQRFSPYSEWFVHAAAMAEAVNNDDEKTQAEIATHIFFTMTQNFFDKSFATGMHDFLEAMSNPERSDSWVQNFITGATVPNFIPLAARTVDPTVRESSNLREAYISKIPYLSQTLPAKTDVFGEPITRAGSTIARAISPVIPSKIEVDMVREELKTIGYQMGFPGKTAGGFEMEEETYRIYQSVSGKIVYKTLFQMMQSPGYQGLSPRQKEKTVDKIVRDTREAVKQRVAQDQLIMQEIKNRLKDKGYSTKQSEEIAEKTFEKIKARSEE